MPPVTFGPNGFIAPTEAAILAGVQADQNAAFGGNLNSALNTPQGQLATSLTAIIGDSNDQFLFYTNNVDPAYASGRMQDAIGRVVPGGGFARVAATSTIVTATCTGLSGTVIPIGALAQASDGNLYACLAGGTIPVGGSISLSFACTATGPIACPATSLNQIYQAIPGWDTISNPNAGAIGNNVETRAAFEARRSASVAANSVGSIGAILGAVLSVPGVTDAYVIDNPLGTTATIGGVTLAAHSLYVAAVGGTSAAVAKAIWTKKAPGCNYNGNTTVTVTDPNPIYGGSPPSYSVTYEIPPALQIIFAVSITNSTAVPSNALTLIQGAIQAAFTGADGGSRARIGSELYALRYVGGIAALGAWAAVISIQIGSANTAAATFTGVIAGTALTTSSPTGTIAIGQTVIGANVAAGTKIVSGSGSSWVVSVSQTVSSSAMSGIVAGVSTINVNINQVPAYDPANVTLTLV